MDDNNMKIQATVDMPSAKEVDKQIHSLEKNISKLKVSGKFDDTSLKNLTNQLNTLKATVSTANFSPAALTGLTSQVEKALSKIPQEVTKVNSAMTELGTASDASGSKISTFFDKIAENAKKLEVLAALKNVGKPKMFGFNLLFEYADNNMCSLGY